MKKFDKTFGSMIDLKPNEYDRVHELSDLKYCFYWKGHKIIKSSHLEQWSFFLELIFKTNFNKDFFEYIFDFKSRYFRFRNLLVGLDVFYGTYFGAVFEIHYDNVIIKNILKPDRIIVCWGGFKHTIYLEKNVSYFSKKDNSNIEHIMNFVHNTDDCFAKMLEVNVDNFSSEIDHLKGAEFSDIVKLIDMINE